MDTFKIKKGLGRGLSSLIGETKSKDKVNKVAISDLVRNKYQPRKVFNKENLEELTNSIKERGIIQPILVRSIESNDNKYEVISIHYNPIINFTPPTPDLFLKSGNRSRLKCTTFSTFHFFGSPIAASRMSPIKCK